MADEQQSKMENSEGKSGCASATGSAVFATKELAEEWMEKKVDDSCIDNHRFAFLDDSEAMQKYQLQKSEGCCGDFDEEIIVAGRHAMIGCNYGH